MLSARERHKELMGDIAFLIRIEEEKGIIVMPRH
jgi:hypothetical protein